MTAGRERFHGEPILFVYTVVARAFPEICGNWFNGCHVHHKDGNPLNNKAENLICLSPAEHNLIHKKGKRTRLGIHHTEETKRNISEKLKGRKLPPEQVEKMKGRRIGDETILKILVYLAR